MRRILYPLALLALTACGPEPAEAPSDGEAVRQRAVDARTVRGRTGAEVQDRVLNRVVKAVYICNNGERLAVDFDNPREMATVRMADGRAADLRMERAGSGIWYRGSGYELRGEGVMATWTAPEEDPTECRAID